MVNRVVVCCVVVMLMGMPPSGHAACAWILWEHTHGFKTWSIEGSAETYAICDKALADALQQQRSAYKALEGIEFTKGTGKGSIKTSGDPMVTYYCLPDTVDPRKP